MFEEIFNKEKRDALQKQYTNEIYRKTMHYQKKYGFKVSSDPQHRAWNNEADAFKHTFGAADTTIKEGDFRSWLKGVYHETQTPNNPQGERNMDIWNNKVGRQIGKEVKAELMGKRKLPQNKIDDIIAEKIMRKMNQGKLITNPKDIRALDKGEQMSKQWQKFLNDAKNNNASKFTKLEPANLGTSNQPVAGVANAKGVADTTELLVKYTPITYENPLAWLGQLGSILSGAAGLLAAGVGIGAGIGAIGATSAAGVSTSVFAEIAPAGLLHTGGTVVPKYKGGRNEMMAILQGGETVRTEAQEKELQDAKMKEFLEAYAPLVSGEDNGQDPYAQVFGNNKSQKKDPKMPVLMNKTRHDEEMIIAIVADAWKFNRSGFRNALRYN